MKRRTAKRPRHTTSSSKGKMSLKKIVIIAIVVVLALIAFDKMTAPKTHSESLESGLDNVPIESSVNLEGYKN